MRSIIAMIDKANFEIYKQHRLNNFLLINVLQMLAKLRKIRKLVKNGKKKGKFVSTELRDD